VEWSKAGSAVRLWRGIPTIEDCPIALPTPRSATSPRTTRRTPTKPRSQLPSRTRHNRNDTVSTIEVKALSRASISPTRTCCSVMGMVFPTDALWRCKSQPRSMTRVEEPRNPQMCGRLNRQDCPPHPRGTGRLGCRVQRDSGCDLRGRVTTGEAAPQRTGHLGDPQTCNASRGLRVVHLRSSLAKATALILVLNASEVTPWPAYSMWLEETKFAHASGTLAGS
jgi:hypothetical protein